jgi:hypothetical protein
LEALTSQPNGWDGKTYSIANGTSLDKKYYIIIGLKQFHIMTLLKQTSLFTEDTSTSSPEDSLASHTQWQENEKAKKTSDISGQKCLEQLEKFSHVGSWAKTFSALLIGQGDWYSTRCKLTWKLRGTKYGRMYFQLYPSTLPTAEIEFGLWPTPNAVERHRTDVAEQLKEEGKPLYYRRTKDGKARQFSPLDYAVWAGMLPTPTAMDTKDGQPNQTQMKNGRFVRVSKTTGTEFGSRMTDVAMVLGMLPTPKATEIEENYEDWKKRMERSGNPKNTGKTTANLGTYAVSGMLPTPRANQVNGCDLNSESLANRNKGNLEEHIAKWVTMLPTPAAADGFKTTSNTHQENLNMLAPVGTRSHLNPPFVLEMMGFPPNWTELPFQNGETNQSKQQVTQSSHK